MEELRLPWNHKEGLVFGLTIAAISAAVIGGANIYLAVPHDKFVYAFLTSYPFVLPVVVLLSSTVVGWIQQRVVRRYMKPTDSTNTYICFNLIVCVFLMSVTLSFLGPVMGQTAAFVFSGEPFDIPAAAGNWIHIWPRNFCIAFFVEMCLAQPAARMLMVSMHRRRMSAEQEAV